MSEFLYVLSFNPFGDNPNPSQVDIFVRSHRDISTWYFPYLGTYMFKSARPLVELSPAFRQFFGNAQFSLTFASPQLVGGTLPQNVWDWMNNVSVPALGATN